MFNLMKSSSVSSDPRVATGVDSMVGSLVETGGSGRALSNALLVVARVVGGTCSRVTK